MKLSNSYCIALLALAAESLLAWLGKPTGAATPIAGHRNKTREG